MGKWASPCVRKLERDSEIVQASFRQEENTAWNTAVTSIVGSMKNKKLTDFPGCSVDKNLPANSGDKGWILGLERSHIPWIN